jgi:hypothetical protein
MEIAVGLALGYALSNLAHEISISFVEFWRYRELHAGDPGTDLALENLFSEGFALRIGDRYLDLNRILAALLQGLLILVAALFLWREDRDAAR